MTAPTGRPRGRPRKNPLGTPLALPPGDEAVTGDVVDPPPATRRTGSGRKDSKHFAEMLAEANELQMESLRSGQGGIPNYPTVIKGIEYEASMNGVKTADIVDQRTEIQMASEVLSSIYGPEKRGILEVSDEELSAIERFFEMTNQMSKSKLALDMQDKDEERVRAESLEKKSRELGKLWGDRIQRLRKIRASVRNPYPPNTRDREERHALAAVQTLRYAIYVMRSNIPERLTKGGVSALLDIKPHHVAMAWVTYIARNNLETTAWGVEDCGFKYEGVILVLPPGHGKTTMAFADLGLRISQHPYTQLLCGHAESGKASANLRYLAHLFSDNNPAGRRNIALFPDIRLESVSNKRMSLKTKEKSKSATSSAFGIHSKIGGVDASEIWLDDPVDPSEAEQPEQRRRTHDMITGQWKDRVRGRHGFSTTTATLWHDDDSTAKRIELAKAGKANLAVYVQSCGGPNSHPPFKSIWPELYPASDLRQKYAANPGLYAATYMCEPRPESLQIIKKLRYYDPNSPQHLAFKKGATFYVSLDPSATTNPKSDKAGIVYGGFGLVTGDVDGKLSSEYRLRIEGAKQMLATQSDLVQHVCNFAFSSPVNDVLFENVNGYMGFGEMLENELGIKPIGMPTGNRSKEIRLRQVAGMMEHTIPDGPEGAKVFGGAVVEFPGVRLDDGSIGPDPEKQWYFDQILKYGSVKDKGCLDATTQLIWHLVNTGDLVSGAGRVTDIIRSNAVNAKDNRVRELFKHIFNPPAEKDHSEQEAAFFGSGNLGAMEWNN